MKNDTKPVILVVDDIPDNITLLSGLLRDLYKVRIAVNGEKALNAVRENPPDLILLDVMMPVLDGYETCRRLKQDEKTRDIPVIFLTAKSETEDESRGFMMGAADYIMKPVNPTILLSRVKTHIALKQAGDFLKAKNTYLESEVSKRTRELSRLQEMSIMALASLAEKRDNETGRHIQRTKLFVQELLLKLRESADEGFLSQEEIDLIVASAPLHDIGKVGIPDSILLKPGKLSADEFEVMKTHTTLGLDAILCAENFIHESETFFKYAKEIIYCHHEKWDGSGYPQGLSGENIPLSARIMAAADVYDALTSKRVYKSAMSHEEAIAIIRESSGKHFDPKVVEMLLTLQDDFQAIANKYKDNE